MNNFKLYSLSPIHIGSGYSMDPFSYIIKDDNLYSFDFLSFSLKLKDTERHELKNRISNPDYRGLLSLRKYIIDIFDKERFQDSILFEYNIKSKGIIKYYNESIYQAKKEDIISALSINNLYRDHFYNAQIPGSSIKGALRHIFIKINNIDDNIIKQHLFKVLKVSDTVSDKVTDIDIGFIQHIPKDSISFANRLFSICEHITCEQTFNFTIDINKNILEQEYISKGIYQNKTKLNINVLKNINHIFSNSENLFKMLNKYYKPKVEDIVKMLENKFGDKHKFVALYNKQKDKIDNNSIGLVNIGKYGGLLIKDGKGKAREKLKYRRYVTSTHISNDIDIANSELMPLGWAVIYQ